jgi:hypothetical protein
VGSIFDDLDEVAEEYEDNNAAVYCEALIVNQLAPVINELDQDIVPCGVPYTGPTPIVTRPLNAAPITWSIDNPEPGMTINPATGVISWSDPVHSPFLYTLILRATNGAGSAAQTLFLGVELSVPEIADLPDEEIACRQPYTGPTPTLTAPECMMPILNWTLDAGPAGMTIDHDTGVVSWPEPWPSLTPYAVTIRASNAAGSGTESWDVTVWTSGGDFNGDDRVNLSDFSTFAVCYAGPTQTTPPGGCTAEEFAAADLDCDGNVDLADFSTFAIYFGH